MKLSKKYKITYCVLQISEGVLGRGLRYNFGRNFKKIEDAIAFYQMRMKKASGDPSIRWEIIVNYKPIIKGTTT